MRRHTLIPTLFLTAVAGLNAGLIPLTGQATNVAGFGLSGGAAGTYVVSGNCAGLPSNGPNFDGCASPLAATVNNATSKKNYVTSLFESATNATNNLSSLVPNAAQNLPNSSGRLASGFSSGAVFDLMNAPNGIVGGAADGNLYWSSASYPDIIIPVGIYNVTAVDTMINDYYGQVGHGDIKVTFCFSSDSVGTTCNNVSVTLINGTDVRSAVLCDNTIEGGCTANSAGIANVSNSLAASTFDAGSGITIKTANVFQTSYTSIGSANQPNSGSTGGRLVLDAQQFLLNGIGVNQYLAKITINDTGSNWSTTNTSGSHAALSAVTVETVPEPGTFLIFGAGLLAAGFSRKFRL